MHKRIKKLEWRRKITWKGKLRGVDTLTIIPQPDCVWEPEGSQHYLQLWLPVPPIWGWGTQNVRHFPFRLGGHRGTPPATICSQLQLLQLAVQIAKCWSDASQRHELLARLVGREDHWREPVKEKVANAFFFSSRYVQCIALTQRAITAHLDTSDAFARALWSNVLKATRRTTNLSELAKRGENATVTDISLALATFQSLKGKLHSDSAILETTNNRPVDENLPL